MRRIVRRTTTLGVAAALLGGVLVGAAAPSYAEEEPPVSAAQTEADLTSPVGEALPLGEQREADPNAAAVAATGLDFDAKCGAYKGTVTVGVPATVGSCLFAIVPSALPTSGGTLVVDVYVTPTAAFWNQVVAIGWGEYNVGTRMDGVLGSPLLMTFSLYPVNVTAPTTICNGSATASFEIVTGGSRFFSLAGSKGPYMLSNSDKVNVSANYTYGQLGPRAISVDFDGVCGGNKGIWLSMPSGLASLTGKYDAYTFSFTGIPTSLTLGIEDTSSTVKRITLSHNSNNLSGSVGLSSFGSLSFTNAPKSWDLRIVKDGAGDLSTLTAKAYNAPSSGASVTYNGVVAGITVHVDIRKISWTEITVNMASKSFSGALGFVNQEGFIDIDVVGSWKALAYEVRLDGVGLGYAYLGAGTSQPYVDLRGNGRACIWGCGSLTAFVRLSFFGYNDLGATGTFKVQRRTDNKYNLVVPLAVDQVSDEGLCWTWYFGSIRMCAISI